MRSLPPTAFLDAIDTTWAPKAVYDRTGWRVREGAGGGQRVAAATALRADAAVQDLIAAQAALGQPPLAMIREGEGAVDAVLATAGFARHDPVRVLSVDPSTWPLTAKDAHQTIRGDHTLAIHEEIWAQDGIGPERRAVMARVAGPKAYLLGRDGDDPAGVGFVACDGPVAMLHALYVLPGARGKGVGGRLLRNAADWACAQGATALAVLVREANPQAAALYAKRGMVEVTRYHYRILRSVP